MNPDHNPLLAWNLVMDKLPGAMTSEPAAEQALLRLYGLDAYGAFHRLPHQPGRPWRSVYLLGFGVAYDRATSVWSAYLALVHLVLEHIHPGSSPPDLAALVAVLFMDGVLVVVL